MYFQFGHGLCEQEEDACPSKGTSIWELPAPLQREHQRGGHHLQLGRTHRWKYVNDCLNVKEKKSSKSIHQIDHIFGGDLQDMSEIDHAFFTHFQVPSPFHHCMQYTWRIQQKLN